MPEFKLAEIAEFLAVPIPDKSDMMICGVAALDMAKLGELSFLANPVYRKLLEKTKASAVLISKEDLPLLPDGVCGLVVDDPYLCFARVLEMYHPPVLDDRCGVHPTSYVHPDAEVHSTAWIGEGCSVGANSVIGSGSRLIANVCVYENVSIGRDCLIHSNCSIREGSQIADRFFCNNGVVIGSDGFGFVPDKNGKLTKIPQTGYVQIGADVEIGANTTIDRATMGITSIANGVKLDNQVQIAHNVSIGAFTVIAAQSGVAGSTSIGEWCRLGGAVSVGGHLRIGDRVQIGGRSGVVSNIPADRIYAGFPAREHKSFLLQTAAIPKLPAVMKTIRSERRRLDQLENKLNSIARQLGEIKGDN
jgi:UDP-3-O-[3-hydroxymyristoyl] glucosamine N-acyltransferase